VLYEFAYERRVRGASGRKERVFIEVAPGARARALLVFVTAACFRPIVQVCYRLLLFALRLACPSASRHATVTAAAPAELAGLAVSLRVRNTALTIKHRTKPA
jgi:hypothetical protein